jgi:uncharacterized protein involved in exopolysaccharide biosynthesis
LPFVHSAFRCYGDYILSSSEEQNADLTPHEVKSIHIPVTEIVTALWHRRRWLAAVTGIGLICAISIALLIPNEYQSNAELMPPDPQSLTNTSVLNALTGQVSITPAGSILNARTPSATSIGILSSRTVQDDIINSFNLRQIYHRKLYEDTRNILADRTTFDEDKKNGIISITVMDHDRYRARDITKAYIEELNKLLNSLSESSARREREFLEERLKSIKVELDESSRALGQFSSRNATLDYQQQGEATVDAAARLQGQLITAESDLSGLKAMYSDDNMRVRAARAGIDKLQSKLQQIGGEGDKMDDSTLKPDQLFPSIRKLPLLGTTYYDLQRQVAMKESLYETLTKQYELAKVQEAKEIPAIKILDEPVVAERKSYPHRTLIVLFCTFASACVGAAWIFVCTLWNLTGECSPTKAFLARLYLRIREHDNLAQS